VRIRTTKLSSYATLVCALTALSAEEWPQFRGPNGSGISATSTNLPVEFSPQKNLLWKTALPPGHSSPVFGGGRVFLTAFERNSIFIVGVDQQTGQLLWRTEAPRPRQDHFEKPNNAASSTPVTDGQVVIAFFPDFGLFACDKNGNDKWRLPLGPFNSAWGMAASPVLAGNLVILPCDQDTGSFMIAVHKDTGRVEWKVNRPGVISGYSTPILYQPPNGPLEIIEPESFQLSAYSAESGERVWYVRGLACEMKSIPATDGKTIYINGWGWKENQPGMHVNVMPFEEALRKGDANKDGKLSLGEGVDERSSNPDYFKYFDLDRDGKLDSTEWAVYRAMMAANNGLLSITLGGRGDMTDKSIRWKYTRTVPQVPSTLLYEDILYMVNDGGLMLSFNPATGEVIKHNRLKEALGRYFASPVAGDHKIFFLNESGIVSVVKAAGQWELLATNKLEDECYATPAILDNKIYIRTRGALYCFARKSP
jgi:outer membrane protein assembly factor BamB